MNENQNKNEEIHSKLSCHKCNSLNYCTIGLPNKKIGNCPMIINPEIQKEAKVWYDSDDFIKDSTAVASIVEAKGYIQWPRLKDTIEYAKGMNYKKIGLAFCIGLLQEAEKIAEILEKYEFEIFSVCCKTGGIKKVDVGVPEEYTMNSKTGYLIGGISCNPVAQALLLNKYETDINVIIGLCVGHDITFTQLSKAPVTTLIAKDRANPHNPAAVLNSSYGQALFRLDLEKFKHD